MDQAPPSTALDSGLGVNLGHNSALAHIRTSITFSTLDFTGPLPFSWEEIQIGLVLIRPFSSRPRETRDETVQRNEVRDECTISLGELSEFHRRIAASDAVNLSSLC